MSSFTDKILEYLRSKKDPLDRDEKYKKTPTPTPVPTPSNKYGNMGKGSNAYADASKVLDEE